MYPILISAPASAGDVIGASRNQPIASRWIGHDGSEWDLTQIDGPLLVQNGVIGLHDPEFERFIDESSTLPGHRLRGVRARAREVFWPLLFQSDSVAQWADTWSDFWRSIHPVKQGTWRVGTGDAARELQLTGIYDAKYSMRHDPFTLGWATIGTQLEAAQPFWQGRPITRGPWTNAASRPFFPGPPFRLSSSKTLAKASIPNPGDVETWLTWRAVGPFSALKLGVGGSSIVVPFDLLEGDVLEIDMDPRSQFARLNGEDATEALGFQEFAAVEPGESVPLNIEATGAGSVAASLTPLYFRAFG